MSAADSGRPVMIVKEGTRRHYCVAVEDVAGVAVGCVDNHVSVNRDFLIGGPDALSWREIISAFERVNDVKLEVKSLEPSTTMPGFPEAVAGLMAALETYDSPKPVSAAEAQSLFGVQLTTLEGFLRQKTKAG